MKNKIVSILFICFLILFLIFPFSIVMNANLKIFVRFGCFMALIIFICSRIFPIKKISQVRLKTKWVILGLFLGSLLIRLFVVICYHGEIVQVSDFGFAFEQALNPEFTGPYYTIFYHWILYPQILHVIFQLFGSSQLVAMIVNSVVTSLIPVFIYLIGKKVLKHDIPALLGSVLCALWPINIFYVMILAPDHFSSLLLVIGIYLVLCLDLFQPWKEKKRWKNPITLSVLCGISLALCTFFKDFSTVILVAIPIMLILTLISSDHRRDYIQKGCLFVIILVSFLGVKQLGYLYLEHTTNHSIFRSNLPFYFNVGLNLEFQGSFNDQIYDQLMDKIEYYQGDEEKVNSELTEQLKTNIKRDYQKYPALFYQKTLTAFNDDSSKSYFINSSFKEGNLGTQDFIYKRVYGLSSEYYIYILLAVVAYLVFNMKKQNKNGLFLCVFLFGVCLEFLFVEAQGRYRYAVEPIFALLAGGGCFELWQFFQKREKLELVDYDDSNKTKKVKKHHTKKRVERRKI